VVFGVQTWQNVRLRGNLGEVHQREALLRVMAMNWFYVPQTMSEKLKVLGHTRDRGEQAGSNRYPNSTGICCHRGSRISL